MLLLLDFAGPSANVGSIRNFPRFRLQHLVVRAESPRHVREGERPASTSELSFPLQAESWTSKAMVASSKLLICLNVCERRIEENDCLFRCGFEDKSLPDS
jgi:hypothetical protein